MDVRRIAALAAAHSFQKHAMPFAAAIPAVAAAGKAALPWLGSKAMSIGAKAAPWMIGGAGLELGGAAMRKMTGGGEQPQGPSGPGGTGAGLIDRPKEHNGATHGMLGFPKPQGPKGGYGPPNFGNSHSRDRADPDFGGDETPQSPMAGFKMASQLPYGMTESQFIDGLGLMHSPVGTGLNAAAYGGLGALGGLPFGRAGQGAMIGAGVGAGHGLGSMAGAAAGTMASPFVGALANRLGLDPVRAMQLSMQGGTVAGGVGGAALGGYMGYRVGSKKEPDKKPDTESKSPAEKVSSFVKRAIPASAIAGMVGKGVSALGSSIGNATTAGASKLIGTKLDKLTPYVSRASQAMMNHPGITGGVAMAAPAVAGLGAGYMAGSSGSPEKTSTVRPYISDNLLDVLAANMTVAERSVRR